MWDIEFNIVMIQESHIDAALKEIFDNLTFTPEPSGLYDPLRYMIEIGGKGFVPASASQHMHCSRTDSARRS